MKVVNVVDNKIIFCPKCWNEKRKLKSFKKDKDLNIHLTRKHGSKFKFRIADGSAIVIPRTKSS